MRAMKATILMIVGVSDLRVIAWHPPILNAPCRAGDVWTTSASWSWTRSLNFGKALSMPSRICGIVYTVRTSPRGGSGDGPR